jgi:hypothetical protein
LQLQVPSCRAALIRPGCSVVDIPVPAAPLHQAHLCTHTPPPAGILESLGSVANVDSQATTHTWNHLGGGPCGAAALTCPKTPGDSSPHPTLSPKPEGQSESPSWSAVRSFSCFPYELDFLSNACLMTLSWATSFEGEEPLLCTCPRPLILLPYSILPT